MAGLDEARGRARLWDTGDGRPLTAPLAHYGVVVGATFDVREQRILTWTNLGAVRLWDAAGDLLAEFEGAGRPIVCARFVDDDLSWAVDDDAGVVVLRINHRSRVRATKPAHDAGRDRMAFSTVC